MATLCMFAFLKLQATRIQWYGIHSLSLTIHLNRDGFHNWVFHRTVHPHSGMNCQSTLSLMSTGFHHLPFHISHPCIMRGSSRSMGTGDLDRILSMAFSLQALMIAGLRGIMRIHFGTMANSKTNVLLHLRCGNLFLLGTLNDKRAYREIYNNLRQLCFDGVYSFGRCTCI